MGEPLPEKNRDHDLSGDWWGIGNVTFSRDWLLIYRIEDDVLVLTLARPGRTATCSINESAARRMGNLYGVFSVYKGRHET